MLDKYNSESINQRLCALFIVTNIFVCPVSSNAAIYKCIGIFGGVEFTDQGCKDGQSEDRTYDFKKDHEKGFVSSIAPQILNWQAEEEKYKFKGKHKFVSDITPELLNRQAEIDRKQKEISDAKILAMHAYILKVESDPISELRLIVNEFKMTNFYIQRGNSGAIHDIVGIRQSLDSAKKRVMHMVELSINKNPKWKIQQNKINAEQKNLDYEIYKWVSKKSK